MISSNEVIDVESSEINQQFIQRFHICIPSNVRDTTKFHVLKVEDLPPVYGVHFKEYNVLLCVNDLKFFMEILTLAKEKVDFVRKLTIKPEIQLCQDELIGTINYFKRQRDVNSAFQNLILYSALHYHRDTIIKYMKDVLKNNVDIEYTTDIGYIICFTTRENSEDDPVFSTTWRLWWNCRVFTFFDYISFDSNADSSFYKPNVKKLMEKMTKPKLDFEEKHKLWAELVTIFQNWLLINTKLPLNESIELSDSDSDDVRVVETQ